MGCAGLARRRHVRRRQSVARQMETGGFMRDVRRGARRPCTALPRSEPPRQSNCSSTPARGWTLGMRTGIRRSVGPVGISGRPPSCGCYVSALSVCEPTTPGWPRIFLEILMLSRDPLPCGRGRRRRFDWVVEKGYDTGGPGHRSSSSAVAIYGWRPSTLQAFP